MRDRFKFLRRPKAGEPQHKRTKVADDGSEDGPDVDAELAQLQAECRKRKRDRCMATIQDLTDSTYSARRKWIKDSQPPVLDVLEKSLPEAQESCKCVCVCVCVCVIIAA